jgi:hypothetical protein
MRKSPKRRNRKLRFLFLLFLLYVVKPVPTVVNEIATTTLHPANPLSKHSQWLITRSENDAQSFVMEAVTSGRVARVVPGFAQHYQRYLAGDTTALQNTEFSWDAAAEYLDEAIRTGS